jgi:hypothetical protein
MSEDVSPRTEPELGPLACPVDIQLPARRRWGRWAILGGIGVLAAIVIVGVIRWTRGSRDNANHSAIYEQGRNPLLETQGPACIGVPLGEGTVVYCIDCSSAMRDSFDAIRSAVDRSLSTLGSNQGFGLVVWTATLPSVLLVGENVPAHRQAGLARLDEAQPSGSSNAVVGIRAAVDLEPEVICVIAGKGPPEKEAAAIAEQCRKGGIKVHCLAIGDEAPTLSSLAAKTGGRYHVIDPRDLKTWVAEAQ